MVRLIYRRALITNQLTFAFMSVPFLGTSIVHAPGATAEAVGHRWPRSPSGTAGQPCGYPSGHWLPTALDGPATASSWASTLGCRLRRGENVPGCPDADARAAVQQHHDDVL